MISWQTKLEGATQELRQDWSFLEPYGLPTEKVKNRSAVFERQVIDAGNAVDTYVKIYANKRHPMQRIFRPGRSRIEASNLLFFKSIGIAVPRILGWGEQRNAIGRIVQEFIITEAISEAEQLDKFVPKHCPEPDLSEHRTIRMHIIKQLAQWTRAMHDEGFIHEDLKWRNILARETDGAPELFYIDCPIGHFTKPGPEMKRKQLKDCATLDKLARHECTKEEREAFIRAYLGPDFSEKHAQKLCQEIEDYRRQRFDPKDNRQRRNS
jgi:tRNA A-37 threonylcarbamoyl transferase component Bud32